MTTVLKIFNRSSAWEWGEQHGDWESSLVTQVEAGGSFICLSFPNLRAAATIPAIFLRDLAILYMENNLYLIQQLLKKYSEVSSPKIFMSFEYCSV